MIVVTMNATSSKRASGCQTVSPKPQEAGAKYCNDRVCMSVCPYAYLKNQNHMSKLHQIICACYTRGCGSVLSYLTTMG